MLSISRTGEFRAHWITALGLAALGVFWLASDVQAQDQNTGMMDESKSTIGGFRRSLPGPPVKPPRPLQGPEGVASFVDSLSSQRADGLIEVVMGRPRVLTFKEPLADPEAEVLPQIAIGDPSIINFEVVSLKQLRIVGIGPGVTDLTIVTPEEETYIFRVQVVYDLDVLRAQLKAVYPEAHLRLTQIREHVVVEGQARDTGQVTRILTTVRAYLQSMAAKIEQPQATGGGDAAPPATGQAGGEEGEGEQQPTAPVEEGGQPSISAQFAEPQLINLIRVPTSQQVLLKVKVMELNRQALRDMGVNWQYMFGDRFFNQAIGTASEMSPITFNIVRGGMPRINAFVEAVRENQLARLLAEPNLVCLHGQEASFLAGGEFPIIIPQQSGGAGVTTLTVEFREFGTRLAFVPYILDHERVRLTLSPEVVDRDDANAVTFQGTTIPALVTRRAHSTVEMRQGQTLALAGLIELRTLASTRRVPGLGDIPYFGMFWSDNMMRRRESELLILVTPYIVEPMNQSQVGAGPGDEIKEPNDLEFYLLQRIEGRTGRDFRSTTRWDDIWELVRILNLEKRHVHGQAGFSE